MSKSILLVEDDPTLGFVIKDNLIRNGYHVVLGCDGNEGFELFKKQVFQLCILDVMMPIKDGFTLASEIRNLDSEIPILFLTAKVMMEDKLEGFRSGADDYITKPFSFEELLYRIEVFLKRSARSESTSKILSLGKYHFDPTNFKLTYNDNSRILTSRESQVLRLLYENRNRVLKREEILKKVWGDDDYFLGRSMDVLFPNCVNT